MATPTKRFVLKFSSDRGKLVRISIPRARMGKTASQVEATMTALIQNGTIMFTGIGTPISIKGAQIVETAHNTIV
jgi:hypothetical protein